MQRFIFILLGSLYFFAFHPSLPQVEASEKISGQFTASRPCQAYVSIKKRSNPGDIHMTKGESYPLRERNVPSGATWYRIRVDGASPEERWVYYGCGQAELSSTPVPAVSTKKPCQTAGQADSYVFAVSWQPAFCESHQNKPECKELVEQPDAYAAGNFTLHGLWPNKSSCGTNYGFCGQQKKIGGSFCSYPRVPMSESTLQALGKVMPAAAAGSCLQRHEWFKHGTCQTKMDADQYWDLAIDLVGQFNTKGMSAFMQENIGRTVAAADFYRVVDTSLGQDAHKRMKLGCRSGNLVDIYMQLPKEVTGGRTLGQLLAEAPTGFSSSCGESFKVDAVGYER